MRSKMVKHDGSGCPVDGDDTVIVEFRDGLKSAHERADYWLPDDEDPRDYWRHNPTDPRNDIVGYWVVLGEAA